MQAVNLCPRIFGALTKTTMIFMMMLNAAVPNQAMILRECCPVTNNANQ
jgi:hypothetical protein